MKKIFNICLVLAAAALTACSDDNAGEQYLRQNTVGVTSSDLSFDADAHQGGVKFTMPQGATATAFVNASWAKAEVKGDSVLVSVANNPNLESRAAMLTIKSGTDSTNVPISQKGCEFAYRGAKDYVVGDKDTTLILPFSNVGAEPQLLSDNQDAIASVVRGDTAFAVTIKANTTGDMRQVNLFVNNQGVQDTVSVRQGELSDFVNKAFYLTGFDLRRADENTQSLQDIFTAFEGEIKQKGKSIYFVSAQAYINKLPLTFDPSTLSFALTGGNVIGTQASKEGKYTLYNSIWSYQFYMFLSQMVNDEYMNYLSGKVTEEEYIKFQQQMPKLFALFDTKFLSMVAPISYTKDETGVYIRANFMDSGNNDWMAKWWNKNLGYSATTYDANMLCIDAFNSDGSFESPISQLVLPELFRVVFSVSGGAKSLRFMRKAPKMSLADFKQITFPQKKALLKLRK